MSDETRWWWLSFADPDRPKRRQFLGVAIVQADAMASALTRSHVLGVNPGGEVLAAPITDDLLRAVPRSYRNRLLGVGQSRALVARIDHRARIVAARFAKAHV